MSVNVPVAEVGGERTYAEHCFHLPGDIQVVYRSDGSIRMQSASKNIVVTEVKNWSDGFHLRVQPYDSPKASPEHELRVECAGWE